MRCEMEVEEIEAILEKIWDLHDQISDAIHLVTRAHFLNSTKPQEKKPHNDQNGFVFMKESQAEKDEFAEAKSLNVIRAALENLEDQLEFYHTVQSHQRVERDRAIAQLEQSRLLLAMKLVDYRGKKYSVIDEALAFVGGVENFIAPDDPKRSPPRKSMESPRSKGSNFLLQMFACSFNYAKRSLNLATVAGLIGNAALIAVSMIAVLQLHQLAFTSGCVIDAPRVQKNSHPNAECGGNVLLNEHRAKRLDVLMARG